VMISVSENQRLGQPPSRLPRLAYGRADG